MKTREVFSAIYRIVKTTERIVVVVCLVWFVFFCMVAYKKVNRAISLLQSAPDTFCEEVANKFEGEEFSDIDYDVSYSRSEVIDENGKTVTYKKIIERHNSK